jgi:hypothetical protein
MITLSQLHDATLLGLELNWPNGELRLNFSVEVAEITSVRLLATGVRLLNCPRQYPWGRSVSVNSILADRSDKEVVLVIKMQSGDDIEAHVESFALE